MSLTEGQDGAAQAATTGEDPAVSPSAEQGAEKSLTDAVLAALDEPEGSPTSTEQPGADAAKADVSTSDDTSKADGSSSEDGSDKTELTDEEMSQLNTRTRARIEDLLSQRREKDEALRTVQAEITQIKPAAEQYGKIQRYMRENDISPQDMGRAMSLAGLISTNPIEAFRQLQPIYAELARVAGAALPADLAEDVRLGKLTRERAQELSQARAATQAGQKQVERRQQRDDEQRRADAEQREVETRRTHAAAMGRVGDTLAAEKAQTDPDWKLKEPLMVDALEADVARNGFPKDEADLRERFKGAYDAVSKRIASFRPAPRPTQKQPQSSSSPGSHSAPPKTVQEAVLRALD